MPWNDAVEQEYDQMLAGPAGDAMDYPGFLRPIARMVVKAWARELETGFSSNVNLEPEDPTYLTWGERFVLHTMRVACSLFAERLGVFPWRLEGRTADDLRPLLSWHSQGLREWGTDSAGRARHVFHGVWDVNPADRMNEAVFGYFLLALLGDAPSSEMDMVVRFIQNMRDSGWGHVSGLYENYEGYEAHSPDGIGTYAYEDVAEVKRGGCHMTSNYIASFLRSFNIPTHMGRDWPAGGAPSDYDQYWGLVHRSGHCFVHFHGVGWWLSHGDDIYNRLLKTIPPGFAMKSEHWMRTYHFDTTEYEWTRAAAYDSHFWWCLLIAPGTGNSSNVAWLYQQGLLRDVLENIHEEYNLADRDGAPPIVPPVFDQGTVDFLMAWVAAKVD